MQTSRIATGLFAAAACFTMHAVFAADAPMSFTGVLASGYKLDSRFLAAKLELPANAYIGMDSLNADFWLDSVVLQPSAVPEAGTVSLMGIGMLTLAGGFARRRRF